MFRTLLLSAALAGIAPVANAGDVRISLGYSSHSGIRVGVGLREGHAHRHVVHHDTRVWVPGRTERIAYQVWVPARTERVLVPSRYETRRLPCGEIERILVERRHYETRVIPGHYETRYRIVEHPGCWEVRSHVHVHNHAPYRGIETLRRDRHYDRRGDRRHDHRDDRRDDRRGDRRDGRRTR